MSTAPDKYDEAIAYLTAHPEEIYSAWCDAGETDGNHKGLPGVELFAMARRDGKDSYQNGCGCLTMIRNSEFRQVVSADQEKSHRLTQAIRADHRLPCSGSLITPADLPVFAEWQRRLDRELNEEVSS